MSFQTIQADTNFGISGERIITSSSKGQIFDFQNIIYILYTESLNHQYSIVMYQPSSGQKSILYTSELYPIIQTLKVDTNNRRIWIAGYIHSPMNAFYTSTSISSNSFSPISSLTIREDMKTIETITIVNDTTVLFSGISLNNECWIITNLSFNIYKINTTLSSFSVKDIYIRNRIYHIFIEGFSSSSNRNVIEMYKINTNTLNRIF